MYTEYSIYLSLFVQTSKIYTGCCPSDFLKLCSRRSGQVGPIFKVLFRTQTTIRVGGIWILAPYIIKKFYNHINH